ncbi:MAG: methylenetetrahydrofolate reductase [Nitrococcus sp.]|nr:methylenetetrahydrofolate reductase [Nitrococcus sp.]
MSLPKTTTDRSVAMYLEAVPPLLRQGAAGIDMVLEKIDAIHREIGLDGVNIPEIRPESSKSNKGERLRPFEPRVEPRELAKRIQEDLDVDCVINRVVVHLAWERQAEWFRQTWEEYGIRQFVLVGGESANVHYPGPSVPETNELVHRVIDDCDLRIGNICIPTRMREAERMARKRATGADFFTTQILYHAREFTDFLDEIEGLDPPLAPTTLLLTLCPVQSQRNIRFLHWLGVSLSAELEAWLTDDPEQVSERSLEHLERMWAQIHQHWHCRHRRFSVGISLAPIGQIPPMTTVRLARNLVAVVDRPVSRVC